MELEYLDRYFRYQGERIDIDEDDIIWKEEVETFYEEVPLDEDEIEVPHFAPVPEVP